MGLEQVHGDRSDLRSRLRCARFVSRGLRKATAACVSLGLTGAVVAAGAADPVMRFTDRADGISCSYFDVGLTIPWAGGRPTFSDELGAAAVPAVAPSTGADPRLARERLEPADTRRVRRLDVTALVRRWWEGSLDNDGVLLRSVDGDPVGFHAREDADPALRPQLVLSFAGGRTRYLEATADASLDCSTYTSLGPASTLLLHKNSSLALRFDLERLRAAGGPLPEKAELVLVRTPQSSSVRAQMQLSRLISPLRGAVLVPTDGLARKYPGDRNIKADPDVLFADGFEAGVASAWTVNGKGATAVLQSDAAKRFEPLAGPAMKVVIPRGQNLGLDLRYKFAKQHGSEPDEMYFRYCLRLASDWLQAAEGGKLPGFAATYNKAAWGGRPWDGDIGWSLRGFYGVAPRDAGTASSGPHPAAGKVLTGTYAYHSKADRIYGEGLPWIGGGLAALLTPDRWSCIEQHLKLNTPGREDGVLRVWVDGKQVMGRADLRLRDRPGIRIEEVWMNFYHGGTQIAPVDLTAYVDQVVIARRYIGPWAP
jgi:hypothetical protein